MGPERGRDLDADMAKAAEPNDANLLAGAPPPSAVAANRS